MYTTRFNSGQMIGSMAAIKICVGDCISVRMFFDQLILMWRVKESRTLKRTVLVRSCIISSMRPISCHWSVNTDSHKHRMRFTTLRINLSYRDQNINKLFPFDSTASVRLNARPSNLVDLYLLNHVMNRPRSCGVARLGNVVPRHVLAGQKA